VGESVRRILQHGTAESRLFDETELLLFAASRSQLVRQVIVPALSSGEFVVCDRFIDSTVAYQAFARGLNSEDVSKINEFACDGVIPDLTFLLDLDVKRGFERIQQRNMRSSTEIDRIEKEDMAFHEKVREGYLKLAKSEPGRIHTICSERGPDVIEAEIWQIVEKKAFAEDR
jgi:dTMP kinase